MAIYIDKLYERIIQEEALRYNELRIISGYGSAVFLDKVINEFPHLLITLYIGMAPYGISTRNHEGYKLLMKKFDNLKIFYQFEGIPNHMKIVEFNSLDARKTFIGSANFTENGFMKQREIMTEIKDNMDALFNYQRELSVLCNYDGIEELIMIYSDSDHLDLELPETNEDICQMINERNKKKTLTQLVNLRRNINYEYYKKFDLEIVLAKDRNPRWAHTGINAWMDGKKPTLLQTSKLLFDKVFPIDKTFEIYTDDSHKYTGRLIGRFNGELELVDGNIFNYVKKRIGVKELRPISKEDLLNYGNTRLFFERLNEDTYIMIFDSKD